MIEKNAILVKLDARNVCWCNRGSDGEMTVGVLVQKNIPFPTINMPDTVVVYDLSSLDMYNVEVIHS